MKILMHMLIRSWMLGGETTRNRCPWLGEKIGTRKRENELHTPLPLITMLGECVSVSVMSSTL